MVVQNYIQNISDQLLGGIGADQVVIILILFISYPLAMVFRKIPNDKKWLKNVYSFVPSILMLLFLQELYVGLVHLLVHCAIVYIMIANLRGKAMTYSVFIYSMIHMSYSQYLRQISEVDQTRYDHTGPQMLLVIKFTSLAFSLYDGRDSKKKLTPYGMKNKLTAPPGILEYLGYAFFFPTLNTGPTFEFSLYKSFINADSSTITASRVLYGYDRMLRSLFWLAVFFVLGGHFQFSQLLLGAFGGYSLSYRLFYIYMCGVVARSKFYIVWRLSEGASVISGLGFTGYNQEDEPEYAPLANVKISKIELASDPREFIGAWNICTNTWLKEHVYIRSLPHGKRSSRRSTILTFLVSAWWHGFYPGYYLTFAIGAVISNTSRDVTRLMKPFYSDSQFLGRYHKTFRVFYNGLSIFVTSCIMSFAMIPFFLLNIKDSWEAWGKFNYYVIFDLIIVNILLHLFGGKAYIRRLQRKYLNMQDGISQKHK